MTQRTCSIENSGKRMPQLSLMRIAACFGIIVLHTVFAANEYFADGISGTEDLVSRMTENNMMWAVPTFIMVTGALQLDPGRKLTLKKLYGRYILRIAIALVACCIIFRIFDMIMDGEAMSLAGVGKAFVELITAHSWGHLWYLYLLIGIYVLLPFYRMIAEKASDREMFYLCGVYFLFVSLIPMVESLGVNIAFYISESIIYPLYLFLGHMLHENRLRMGRTTALLLLISSTAAILIMDLMKYRYMVDIPAEFFGYASPFVIIQATSLFALVDKGNRGSEGEEKTHPMLDKIDGCTFGVYLIHMIFVRLIFRYLQWDPYQAWPLISLPLAVAGIALLSFGMVWILKKIPGVKWVL